MARRQVSKIKNWIKEMGFKLVKSHTRKQRKVRINYYNLGNFGVYEQIVKPLYSNNPELQHRKFIAWTPYGEHFEVSSIKDLSSAYHENLLINPELSNS